jgi:hypothetical protein
MQREDMDRLAAVLGNWPFGLYGLPPSWRGPRWVSSFGGDALGGSGGDSPHWRLGLGHGGVGRDAAVLRVESWSHAADEFADAELAARRMREFAVLALLLGGASSRLSRRRTRGASQEWLRAQAVDVHAEAGARAHEMWPVATVSVDGVSTELRVQREGQDWIGLTEVGGAWLCVHGRGWEYPAEPGALQLVRVRDLTPYIEGSRRLAGLEG